MTTVLITGCSMRASGIIDALRNNFEHEQVRIVGVDCNEDNLKCSKADVTYVVPKIGEALYIPSLLKICADENVDVLFPYITAELELIAANKPEFESKGIKVSVDDKEVVGLLNNKMRLYGEFWNFMPWHAYVKGVDDLLAAIDDFKDAGFPICCKIANGRGGQGFAVVDDEEATDLSTINSPCYDRYISEDMLIRYVEQNHVSMILSEYIYGLDYSVYVFADHGKVRYRCGIAGYYVNYGSIVYGEIVDNEKAFFMADQVIKKTGYNGVACLDFKIDKKGRPYLLEVNPRLGASTQFVAKAGLNLPYLSCMQLLGRKIDGYDFSIHRGLKMSKYYTAEYFV